MKYAPCLFCYVYRADAGCKRILAFACAGKNKQFQEQSVFYALCSLILYDCLPALACRRHDDSQSLETVHYGHELRGTRKQERVLARASSTFIPDRQHVELGKTMKRFSDDTQLPSEHKSEMLLLSCLYHWSDTFICIARNSNDL
jgi:hypothetical protein